MSQFEIRSPLTPGSHQAHGSYMLSGKHSWSEAMAHDVDGYQLAFTGRNTWRAEWREGTKLLGVVPVTRDVDRVWYRKRYWDEMETRLADKRPFVIALSMQEGTKRGERKFKGFRALYEVVATGKRDGAWGIETRIV